MTVYSEGNMKQSGKVEPEREGWIRAFIKGLRGSATDFLKEATANSIEYTTDIPNVIVGIIPYSETEDILYVFDNADGIEQIYWLGYCTKINQHINPKGKLGQFGEGVRKAGLSSSVTIPRQLFTVTKALNEERKQVLFELIVNGQQDFNYDTSKIPNFLNGLSQILSIESHGTKQFILSKKVEFDDIREFLAYEFSLGLRSKQVNITLILHKQNSLLIDKDSQVIAPSYGAKQPIDSWTFRDTLLQLNIPIIGFIEVDGKYAHGGETRYFVNGIKVNKDRQRRDDVICECDLTTTPTFFEGILTDKTEVTETVYETICKPMEEEIKVRYKERQQQTVSQKMKEITDKILERLLKKFKNFGKNKTSTTAVKGHKSPQFLFKCNDCGNKWFSNTRNIDECPKCHSKNIKYIKQYTPNPPNPQPIQPNGDKKNKKGRKTILNKTEITIDQLALGGKDFVTFQYPTILFDADHRLYKKINKLGDDSKEQVFTAFISLILNLWNDSRDRFDTGLHDTLLLQLEALVEDYLLV